MSAHQHIVKRLPTPTEEMLRQRYERIAIRAHEIYEARGGEHGQDLDDWLTAERQIDSEAELEMWTDEDEDEQG